MLAVVEAVNGSVVIDANVAAIITALALLVTSITGLIVALKTQKGLGKVEHLVNSHATDQANEIKSLTRALADAGIVIPQPLPPSGGTP